MMTPFHIVSSLLVFFFAISTSFAMLPLRSCRRSIASSPRWCRAQAHIVSLPGNSAHTQLVIFARLLTSHLLPADWNNCSCCPFQHLQTAHKRISWSWLVTSLSAMKVSPSSGDRKEGTYLSSVFWWQHLCLKAAPTTSPFCCGCWTLSPSLLRFAFWDRRPTWSSEKASMLTLEDESSCRGCTTGIM